MIICGETAKRFWRSRHPVALATPQMVPAGDVDFTCTGPDDIASRDWRRLEITFSVHILVRSKGERGHHPAIIYHVHEGELPEGSIVHIEGDLYVVSPALCFAQMASEVDSVELGRLGNEFCGGFSIDNPKTSSAMRTFLDEKGRIVAVEEEYDYHECGALASVEQLGSYVTGLKGKRGFCQAERALRYMIDGTFSPMESIVSQLLIFPLSDGGYGLPKPKSNLWLYPTDKERGETGKQRYACDFYWDEQKVGVEYVSSSFHSGAGNVHSDSHRTNILRRMGLTIVTITWEEVDNRAELDDVVETLYKLLGVHPRAHGYDFKDRQKELRSHLPVFR